MWTRKELKEKAKASFKLNYWKTVLVALLVSLLIGGGSGAFGSGAGSAISSAAGALSADTSETWEEEYEEEDYADDGEFSFEFSIGGEEIDDSTFSEVYVDDESAAELAAFLLIFMAIFGVIFLVILAVSIAISILLLNPLDVGTKRFFVKNLNEKGQIKELAFAFDRDFLNTVKVMFFKALHTFLWSLLFFIPGVVKSYEYRMIPYLLAENPEMSKDEAFARSKEMMTGNKWRAFVLDLSFIPWYLLSAITLGIVGIFYVEPYVNQTNAALYEALKNETYGNETAGEAQMILEQENQNFENQQF